MGKLYCMLVLSLASSTSGLNYDLNDVLGKSILFYEAQRSGWYNGRVAWRGDSCVNDRGKVGAHALQYQLTVLRV